MTDLAQFPPLPEIPPPPATGVDTRQKSFHLIMGQLTDRLFGNEGQMTGANIASGCHASAVDLGMLQDLLGGAIVRFDIAQVRDRWEDDLFAWMRRAVMTWVQRCKLLQMTIEENGIRVNLETQDDHGYYRYEFDVFPGVKRRAGAQH